MDLRYSGLFWLFQSQIIVLYSGFKYNHELIIVSSGVFVTFTTIDFFFIVSFVLSFLFDYYFFQSGAKGLDISLPWTTLWFSPEMLQRYFLSHLKSEQAQPSYSVPLGFTFGYNTTPLFRSCFPCPYHWMF